MKTPSSGKKRRTLAEYLRSGDALRLLIMISGVLLLTLIFEVAIVPVRYDLRVGMVPQVTIAATKDVVDEVATEKKRDQAAAAVTPTYRYQEGVTESVLAHFDEIFKELNLVRQYGDTLPDQSPFRQYSKEELDYARTLLTQITLRDYQLSSLLHATQEELEDAYTLLYTAIQSTMQGHVTEGQENASISSIKQIISYRMSIGLSQNVVPAVLSACIKPNMLIDQEATDAAREQARLAVEDTVYKQGQNIVVRGEGRITAEQLSMLSSLGLLSGDKVDLSMYLGAALLVVVTLIVMLFTLRREKCLLLRDTRRMLLFFLILTLTLILCALARRINVYIAPIILCAILCAVLLGTREGIIGGAAVTVLVASLAAGGSEAYAEKMVGLLVTGLLSGTVAALIAGRKGTRLQILLGGLTAAALDFLAVLAIGLMTDNELKGTLINGAWRAAGSAAALALSVGLQPVLEGIFNLPTPMKLLELSNPNQPLLRRLLLEAPGTYHHSIIVANLAEAAAEAVGANPLLARVGGYYHDIGKLKRPHYFRENQQSEENAHDRTEPQVSAAILTAHTKDGVALGKSYRLPQEVLDIIAEHHGDTPVMFFYHKALQLADGKPVDINAFRYDAHPPKTREGAIVMLCDTIEAAVRTMKNPTLEGVEEFILKLVRGKLEDGQLSDSPLTLRDIDRICGAATTVLSGVFHERIEYPDMEAPKKSRLHDRQEGQKKERKKKEAPVLPPDEAAVPAELPTVEIAPQQTIQVVTPEMPDDPVAVAPMPAISPVAVEDLIPEDEPGEKTEKEQQA